MSAQPDYIGTSNPLDEMPKEHWNCAGCAKGIYYEEGFIGDDDELYCGDCIAGGFDDTLTSRGYNVVYKGNGIFEVKRKNKGE